MYHDCLYVSNMRKGSSNIQKSGSIGTCGCPYRGEFGTCGTHPKHRCDFNTCGSPPQVPRWAPYLRQPRHRGEFNTCGTPPQVPQHRVKFFHIRINEPTFGSVLFLYLLKKDWTKGGPFYPHEEKLKIIWKKDWTADGPFYQNENIIIKKKGLIQVQSSPLVQSFFNKYELL